MLKIPCLLSLGLLLLITVASGWPYGSFLHGFGYPLASHIVFGVVGASLGVVAIRVARRAR